MPIAQIFIRVIGNAGRFHVVGRVMEQSGSPPAD